MKNIEKLIIILDELSDAISEINYNYMEFMRNANEIEAIGNDILKIEEEIKDEGQMEDEETKESDYIDKTSLFI